MPKPGYKSITVSERVYKTFFKVYEENKRGLEIKGIRSFSGCKWQSMLGSLQRLTAYLQQRRFLMKEKGNKRYGKSG
jgi:hypothetical protein